MAISILPIIFAVIAFVAFLSTTLYFQFRKQRTVTIPNPIPAEGFRIPVRPANVKNVYFTKLMVYEDHLEHILSSPLTITIGKKYGYVRYDEIKEVRKGIFGGITIILKPSDSGVSTFFNRLFDVNIRFGNKQNLGEVIRLFARKNVPMGPELEILALQ